MTCLLKCFVGYRHGGNGLCATILSLSSSLLLGVGWLNFTCLMGDRNWSQIVTRSATATATRIKLRREPVHSPPAHSVFSTGTYSMYQHYQSIVPSLGYPRVP